MSDRKELYFHVGNSGVTFGLESTKYGPRFDLTSSSFGNLNTKFDIYTNKKSLLELAELIKNFAEELEDGHKEYVHPARTLTGIEYGSGECSEEPMQEKEAHN